MSHVGDGKPVAGDLYRLRTGSRCVFGFSEAGSALVLAGMHAEVDALNVRVLDHVVIGVDAAVDASLAVLVRHGVDHAVVFADSHDLPLTSDLQGHGFVQRVVPKGALGKIQVGEQQLVLARSVLQPLLR